MTAAKNPEALLNGLDTVGGNSGVSAWFRSTGGQPKENRESCYGAVSAKDRLLSGKEPVSFSHPQISRMLSFAPRLRFTVAIHDHPYSHEVRSPHTTAVLKSTISQLKSRRARPNIFTSYALSELYSSVPIRYPPGAIWNGSVS